MRIFQTEFRSHSIFDVRDDVIGKKLNGIIVQHRDEMAEFVKNNRVDIAILAVRTVRQQSWQNWLNMGIKAIWNFSPADLHFLRMSL